MSALSRNLLPAAVRLCCQHILGRHLGCFHPNRVVFCVLHDKFTSCKLTEESPCVCMFWYLDEGKQSHDNLCCTQQLQVNGRVGGTNVSDTLRLTGNTVSVKPGESEGLKDWITYVGRQCNALWERTCVYPINVNRQPVSTEPLQLTKARFEILILLVCYCWYIIFFLPLLHIDWLL